MTSVDPYILQQASCRASLLVSTAGFRSDDWEDLRQEMVVDCLRRSPKFDPARGDWQGFVRGIVRNHATVLVTRKYRRAQWEVLAEDAFGTQVEEGRELQGILGGLHLYDPLKHLQLRIDVWRVLRKLPVQLQSLALLLSVMPVGDVCVSMGKSRSRIYQLRRELQRAFRHAGFGPAHRSEDV